MLLLLHCAVHSACHSPVPQQTTTTPPSCHVRPYQTKTQNTALVMSNRLKCDSTQLYNVRSTNMRNAYSSGSGLGDVPRLHFTSLRKTNTTQSTHQASLLATG